MTSPAAPNSLDEHERIVERSEGRDPGAAREARPAHLISAESGIPFSDRRRARCYITPETEG